MLRRTWYVQGVLIFMFNIVVGVLQILLDSIVQRLFGDIGIVYVLIFAGGAIFAIVGWVRLSKLWHRSIIERWGVALVGSSPYLLIAYYLYRDAWQTSDGLLAIGEVVISPFVAVVGLTCFMVILFGSCKNNLSKDFG